MRLLDAEGVQQRDRGVQQHQRVLAGQQGLQLLRQNPNVRQINAELKPIRERAAPYEEDPTLVRNIIQDGCEKASDLANDTMRDVREAMGLNYS